MKKIQFLSAAVLCILAAASCAKEISAPEPIRTVISANIVSSKTALGVKEGTSWPNYWKAGDQISVNGFESDALDSEADGKASASFVFNGVINIPFNAAYPASAVSGYNEGSATITIPASQSYVAGSYDPAAFIMTGKSTDASMVALSPFVSLFHLSLDGTASISKVTLTGTEAALSGSFTTNFSGTCTPGTVSSKVEMVAASPVDLPADFFICVPSGLTGSLSVEVFDSDGGSMSKNATIKSALVAGQMYSPPTLTYTPSTSMTITAEGITSSTAIICWGNAPTAAYTVNVYSDSACSTLVDSYAIGAGDSCWGGNSPRFCISGLTSNTTYYVKVVNTTTSVESNVLPVTTAEFTIVEVGSSDAAVNDVILAEDFGELRWDSELINGGVGYFPTSLNSFSNSEVSQFLPIDTNTEKVLGAQTSALATSRLANWAQGAKNNLYIHPGYIKLVGSNNVTHLVTPALDNIPAGKLATLEVKVTASAYFSESSASYATTNAIVAVQPVGSYNTLADETNTNTLDLTSNIAPITLAEETAWNEYTVTLTDVVKGSRLAFGAASDVTKNNARMNISDIKVTIKALDNPALTASVKRVSSSTVAFKWTYGGDAADDIAKPYTASLYSDAACTNLVVSHDFEASASCWDGKSPCFSFGGLTPSSTYWLVVEDTADSVQSDPVSATTEAFTPVDATTVSNAAVGDVILAEDFSEIGWGPDEFAVAAGIVPSPKNLNVLSGANPAGSYTTYSNTGQRIFGTGVDLGTSRLSKGWGFIGNSAVYLRNAYLRITTTASGARTHLVTPALSGIPEGKIATIEVTVTATKHESNDNDVAVFVESNLELSNPTLTDPGNSSYKKYIGASLSDGSALGITKVKVWETKTVSIPNVSPDCRLVIGSYNNIDTKNRFSITDVKVTITALADDPVFKINNDATFQAFVDAVAGGNKTLDAKVTSSFEVSSSTADAFSSIEDYEGTFDGNGKTITGLTKPLFNELKGTAKDLTLNSIINITADQQDLGMLANVLSGTVEGCTSKGSVTFNFTGGINASTSEAGEHRIGGLIGLAASSGASITDCTNEASVTNETTSTGDGELMVGGVLGTFWGTQFSISGCTNTGAVSNNADWNKTISVGGIIGQAGNGANADSDLTVSDCTNEGTVSNAGDSGSNNCVGGIIGWIRFGTYSSNSNSGAISNSGAGNSNCIGGVFGFIDKNGTFQNHSNSGTVSNSGTASSTGAYNGNNGNSIGGIIGYMGASCAISGYGDDAVYKFTNSGDISNSGDAKFVAIGGILGRNTSGVFNMAGSKSVYSTNSGAITESSGNSKANGGAVCVGGIAGLTSTAIKPKYARNSGSILITGVKGTSDNATDIKVGGVGGWISNASLNFNNCRNTGNVTVKATITKGSLWAAGIVALTKDNTAVHSYWYSKATIDTHEATVQGSNFTAGLLGSYESTSAKSFTMYGHKVAGTVWGNKTTTGLFCCTRNSGSTFTFREPSSKPCTIAPGTVRKDDTNNDTVNTIDDVNIGILAGGSGSSSDVLAAIAEESIVVASW
ncbi:MAG: hypothetical protein J6X71_10215 [Bacteroidales bacterium]|nr:hypothetical protein [Bacteroidales bacterium]